MAFKCNVCGIYKGSKARYKGGYVCIDCNNNVLNNRRVKNGKTNN